MMTYLIDLHPDNCAELLASSTLGRLGVVVDGRPEIYPVNYVYEWEKGCVDFPTHSGTKLQAALDWPWVAFEVDGVESDGESGWSVLVVGSASVVTEPDELARVASRRHVPWAGGGSRTWVRITPSKVTGRRICASEHGLTVALG
jgi:nitroimidazol reductase NimA-like FMN-containing flavoprotein (pyridoxamine 5'-phosphate oxidase superfamily)